MVFWVLFISLSLLFFGQMDSCVLLCTSLPEPHVACFLLSAPASQTCNGRDEAEIITLPANLPWATPALIKAVSLTTFLLSWACSQAALPPFPLYPAHISKCSKPLGVLFGCPFLNLTTVYLPAVVEALVHIIFQFPVPTERATKILFPVAHTMTSFSLNSSCTKFLCGKGFS